MCSAEVNRAFARSRRVLHASAAAGTRLCRAVEPAESTSVPAMTRTMTCQSSRASIARRIGSGAIAMALHWAVVLLVFGAWLIGQFGDELPKGPARDAGLFVHMSLGLAIIAFVIARLF